MKRNWAGHCYRPSASNDKVYMVCIRLWNGQWIVIAKWCRRGNKMNETNKATCSTEAAAVVMANKVVEDQKKQGYLELDSSEYIQHMKGSGVTPLSYGSPEIAKHLEHLDGEAAQGQQGQPVQPVSWQCEVCGKDFEPKMDGKFPAPGQVAICPSCIKKAKSKSKKDDDEVMVCVDNAGMEDRFDVGIEYLVENHPDQNMIYAYDKLGRKDEYFKERFVTPETWERKKMFYQPKPGDKVRVMGPKIPMRVPA